MTRWKATGYRNGHGFSVCGAAKGSNPLFAALGIESAVSPLFGRENSGKERGSKISIVCSITPSRLPVNSSVDHPSHLSLHPRQVLSPSLKPCLRLASTTRRSPAVVRRGSTIIAARIVSAFNRRAHGLQFPSWHLALVASTMTCRASGELDGSECRTPSRTSSASPPAWTGDGRVSIAAFPAEPQVPP